MIRQARQARSPRQIYCSRRATELAQEEGFARSMGERYAQRRRLIKQAEAEFDTLPGDDIQRSNKYWRDMATNEYETSLRKGFDQYVTYISNPDPRSGLYKLLRECEALSDKQQLYSISERINDILYVLADDS
jgi:hypothetical protein